MPVGHPSSNPFKNRRMREAADDGMVITMRCGLCKRVAHFWATDLVTVLGDHQVHIAPWPCSKCKTKDYIDMSWKVPSPDMLRGLTVRRPVRKVERWIWRNEKA